MILFLINNAYVIAGQLGLLYGFVLFGLTLRKSLWRETQLYTPDEFHREQLKDHPPGPDRDRPRPRLAAVHAATGRCRQDPGPQEPARPVRADVEVAWRHLLQGQARPPLGLVDLPVPRRRRDQRFPAHHRADRVVLLLGVLGGRGRGQVDRQDRVADGQAADAGGGGAPSQNAPYPGGLHGMHARHASGRPTCARLAARRTTTSTQAISARSPGTAPAVRPSPRARRGQPGGRRPSASAAGTCCPRVRARSGTSGSRCSATSTQARRGSCTRR